MASFEPVEPKVRFPDVERRILAFWNEADVFAESMRRREGAPRWTFYEGPPTANGRPGIHHVEARTFKDVFPRFRTMLGYQVPRKAGWDCHGLPVELEVEKEIGTKGKRDIEAFGIAEFNRLCRASVTRYVDDWERMTERARRVDGPVGRLLDDVHALRRERVVVAEVAARARPAVRGGQGHPVLPAMRHRAVGPRGRAGLPRHRGPERCSSSCRSPSPTDPDLVDARIAVWTTTPWTLLANLGLAVAPDAPLRARGARGRAHRDRGAAAGGRPRRRMAAREDDSTEPA